MCRESLAVICAASHVHIVVGRSLGGFRSYEYSISCDEQEEN
jgi:homoserine acetyltransferase